MRTFTVLSPVLHDGKTFPIGASIELDEADALVLIAAKSIAAPEVGANVLTMAVNGSDYLPALIRLSPTLTVKQTEIVERARDASGLDNAAWNALPDDDREARITIALDAYRAEHAPDPIEAVGIGTLAAAAEGARVAHDNAAFDAGLNEAEAALDRVAADDALRTSDLDPAATATGMTIDSAVLAPPIETTAGAGTEMLGEAGAEPLAQTAAVSEATDAPVKRGRVPRD